MRVASRHGWGALGMRRREPIYLQLRWAKLKQERRVGAELRLPRHSLRALPGRGNRSRRGVTRQGCQTQPCGPVGTGLDSMPRMWGSSRTVASCRSSAECYRQTASLSGRREPLGRRSHAWRPLLGGGASSASENLGIRKKHWPPSQSRRPVQLPVTAVSRAPILLWLDSGTAPPIR